MYILMTDPKAGCKTCGRIPIRYPDDVDGMIGGILKIDFKSTDNCDGKCVGPGSFSGVTNTSASASASASATAKSAAGRLEAPSMAQELGIVVLMAAAMSLGSLPIALSLIA